MIIAYVDRVNLSVALASIPEFKSLFRLTDIDRGTLNSAFFWSYAVLQIPAGWLVDRYGVKFPYAIGFLCWSLVSAATALATHVCATVRAAVSAGGGRIDGDAGEHALDPVPLRGEPARPGGRALHGRRRRSGRRSGAWIAAWLIGTYGWRTMFLILGLGSLIWLVPWLTLVQDDDRQIEKAASRRRRAAARAVRGGCWPAR